ncbi:MAG: F0F1 ATP synthase subunit B [Alphaproteobacteria bacterium]|nr:F0F1 ATP synthase subunit B [Alphaproteobacteria bacterium]
MGAGFEFTPELAVAVAFVIFVVLVLWKGMAKITVGLDKRADQIRAQLDEAQKLREEAQAVLAGYQRQQRDALAEAEEIISHAKEEAERMKVDAAATLATTLKRREEQAVDRIAQAEAKALQDVRNQAVDLAIAATGMLIGESMTSDVQGRLIGDATGELSTKLQ